MKEIKKFSTATDGWNDRVVENEEDDTSDDTFLRNVDDCENEYEEVAMKAIDKATIADDKSGKSVGLIEAID